MRKLLLIICLICSVPAVCQYGQGVTASAKMMSGHDGFSSVLEPLWSYTAARIEWSKIAADKSDNPSVKAFAKTTAEQQEQLAHNLLEKGNAYGAQYARTVEGKNKKTSEKLRTLTGQDFDKEYLKAMQSSGNNVADLLHNGSLSFSDVDIQTFCTRLQDIFAHQDDEAHKLLKSVK
jgi:predicted outer membrane protein